jgi:crotonobetainyl-CoA:carnitine CoA-transferase CaiB-like acyl-CoA transferase
VSFDVENQSEVTIASGDQTFLSLDGMKVRVPEIQLPLTLARKGRGNKRQNVPSTNEILKGVRILTFTTGYAGPFAGRLLASYGAEVIKIESRKGGLDTFRHYGQHKDIDAAPRFIECNLGVRSLSINLKHPTGARLIKELAGKSDAVLQNFRPRVLDKLGLGDDELRKINPQLVIVKLPGFGSEGPKSSYGTWGFNLTAFSGMTYLWNHPDQDHPIGSQGVYPDHLGFIMAPTIMVAALLRTRLTGKGVSIDLAQIEGTAYTLGTTYLDAAINRHDPQPRGNRDPSAAPHGCYRCQGEDRWCAISVRTDNEWRSFCRVIGREELIGDHRFLDRQGRFQHASELDSITQQWTEARSAEEVMNRLQSAGVPAGVVQTGADLLKDPQLRHRNYFALFSNSLIGPFEIPRSGILFRGMTEEQLRLPNRFGSDNEQILGEILRYDKATIAQWRAEEVLT